MKKKILLLVFLLFLVSMSLISVFADTYPSTVSYASEIATNSMSKNMVYVNGTGYMFYFYYYSGERIAYKRASVNDSSASWLYMGSITYTYLTKDFSLDFDDYERIVYFTYAYETQVFFRKGTYSAGNFTWSSEETVFTGAGGGYYCEHPDIAVDKLNSKILISLSYRFQGAGNYWTCFVMRSTDLTGTSWGQLSLNSFAASGRRWTELVRDPLTKNIMVIFNRGLGQPGYTQYGLQIVSKYYQVSSQVFYPNDLVNFYLISSEAQGDTWTLEWDYYSWKTTFYNSQFHIVFQNYHSSGYGKIINKKFSSSNSTWYGRNEVISGYSDCQNTGLSIFGNSTKEMCLFTNASTNQIDYKWKLINAESWSSKVLWLSEPNLIERTFKSNTQHLNDTITQTYLSWQLTPAETRHVIFGVTIIVVQGLIQFDILINGIHETGYNQIAISINDTNYYYGQSANLFGGNYGLSYLIPSNLTYLFNYWSKTGNITILNTKAKSTTLTVSGNGKIILNLKSRVEGFNLLTLQDHLASALGLTSFIAGLLLALVFMMIFLIPVLVFCGRNVLATAIVISLTLSVSVALQWLPIWILIIQVILIVILLGARIRGWISG